jgi:hypothetical protein
MTSPPTLPVSTSRWARLVDRLLDVLLGNLVARYMLLVLVVAATVIGCLYVLRGPLIPTGPPRLIDEGVRVSW